MKITSRKFKHLKGLRHVVDFGKVNDKRLVKIFRTKDAANTWADEQSKKLKKHGHSSMTLSEDDRILFQAARDRLAKSGATITDAVEFYFEKHKPLKESVELARLLDLCMLDMRATGQSDRYLQQFPSSCRSFIRGRELRQAKTITREEVKEWILGNGFAPKTQRVYLGDLRTLFSWGKHEKYLAENPIAGDDGYIELEKMGDEEITCFDVEKCGALLKAILQGVHVDRERAGTGKWRRVDVPGGFRPLLGFATLAMFRGVRPAEVKRTPVAAMDIGEKAVIITGRASKTNRRRVIELPHVALVWLRLWRRLCPDQVQFIPKNFVRDWKAVRKLAGLEDWPHDILRHTAATYDYALHQNAATLKAMLGHSQNEDTLFRHYRAVKTLSGKMVSKKMAERFFKLTPRLVRLTDWPGTRPGALVPTKKP